MSGGKKRRVWWFVGSFVLLSLAFGTVALMVESQGERFHREVQAVVRDYGFVEEDRSRWSGMWEHFDHEFVYVAKGLDEGDIEKIAERFDSACKGCEPTALRGVTAWRTRGSDRLELTVAVWNLDGNMFDDFVWMTVTTDRKRESSSWDRFRSWWPW